MRHPRIQTVPLQLALLLLLATIGPAAHAYEPAFVFNRIADFRVAFEEELAAMREKSELLIPESEFESEALTDWREVYLGSFNGHLALFYHDIWTTVDGIVVPQAQKGNPESFLREAFDAAVREPVATHHHRLVMITEVLGTGFGRADDQGALNEVITEGFLETYTLLDELIDDLVGIVLHDVPYL